MLSSASGEGIGTVLLIDASNSMKGSIKSAMQAARAFAARNPGQPLSVVFFNSKPTVALPLTTDPKQVKAVLAKAPKLGEGTRLYDALAAAVAQVRGSALGAARVVVLSDGDDVGSVTTPGRRDRAAPEREDPRLHGRHRVARLQGRGSPAARGEHRRHLRLRHLGRGADEDLRPAGLRARQRVPAPLPLRGQARPERLRRGRRQGRGAGVVRVHEPLRRDVRPVQAGLARQVLPVVVPHPARRRSSSSG